MIGSMEQPKQMSGETYAEWTTFLARYDQSHKQPTESAWHEYLSSRVREQVSIAANIARWLVDSDQPRSASASHSAVDLVSEEAQAHRDYNVTEDGPDFLERLVERLTSQANVQYGQYICSPDWKRRREWAMQSGGRCCATCSSTKRLEVHHKTYERLGAERLEDLIVLCQACHRAVHRLGGAHRPSAAQRSEQPG